MRSPTPSGAQPDDEGAPRGPSAVAVGDGLCGRREVALGDIPRRTSGRQTAVVDNELLVLDTVDEHLHVLSTSAGLIYSSVDGATAVRQIVEEMSEEFGVEEAVLEGDIVGAVAELIDEGLLVVSEEPDLASLASEGGSGASSGNGRSRRARTAERTHRWERARKRRLDESGPWAVELGPFLVGTATVVVRLDDPAVAALVVDALDLLPSARAGAVVDEHLVVVRERRGAGRWRVYVGGGELVKATSVEAAAESVLTGCNRVATQHPAGAVRFHGGVVEREGRAVVICGVSGAGKSTLTSALVRDGWGYLSDEVAIVDPQTLAVVPYPKWIDLGPESLERVGLGAGHSVGPGHRKYHVPPSLVGSVGGPARVALLVMLASPGERTSTQPEAVLGVDAVRLALGNVFATSWDTPDGLQSLTDVCSQVSVVSMARAPLDEMIAQVTDLWRECADR